MKRINLLFFVVVIFTISACNNKDSFTGSDSTPPVNDNRFSVSTTSPTVTNNPQLSSEKQTQTKINTDVTPTQNQPNLEQRLIIKSGTMSIEIENYEESEQKITELVSSLGGYIVNSNASLNASGKKQGSMTVKVPSAKYDELIAKVSESGKVMNVSTNASDVTEEYIDLGARLKTERELEQRLLDLLSTRAGSLSDVIEVEQKLANVRQKIESTEGRMNFLRKQSDYSTLAVSLFEPSLLTTSSGGGFFYEIGEGIKKGFSGFTEVLSGLITFAIAFSPVLIFLAAAGYFTYRFVKRRSKKYAQSV